MLLYQKDNGQITPLTPQALLNGQPRSYLLFDAESSSHSLYHVDQEGDKKQLLRFPIRILDDSYSVMNMYQRFDSGESIFLTTPHRKKIDYSFTNKEAIFLTEMEQAEIKDSLVKGHRPGNDNKNVWYIKTSLLIEEQQRLLSLGSSSKLPTQSFFDYMKGLELNILEACIRCGNIDDLQLSEEDHTEVRAFRYVYLNPVAINKLSLTFIEALHPTLGMIHDYYVQVIKNYIISMEPERGTQLNTLQKLVSTYAIKLGEKSPDFKEEGIYNPYGLTPKEDSLFRAAALIIGTQNNSLKATVQNILSQRVISKPDLLELLDDIIQAKLYKQTTQQTHNIGVITSLDAIYPGLNCGGKLVVVCDMILSASVELLNDFIGQKNLPIEWHEMIKSSYKPYSICQALLSLRQAHILTSENRQAVVKHQHPYSIAEALISLQQARMLTSENREAVIKHPQTSSVANALTLLQLANLLTPESFEAVTKHRRPGSIAQALISLQQANILTPKNFEAMIKHRHPDSIAQALILLQQANILGPENREVVIKHHYPEPVAEALISLQQADILTPENREAVIKHQLPDSVAEALVLLQQTNILNPENFEAVIKHELPDSVADALISLQQANLLTPENSEAAIKHQDPDLVAEALISLQQANILTPENSEAVIKHQDPDLVAEALIALQQASIFNPENFEAVVKHPQPDLVAKALASLKQKSTLGDVEKVIAAVKALQIHLKNSLYKPKNWEDDTSLLFCFANDQQLLLNDQAPKENANFLAKKIVNKAETLWGLNPLARRIALDTLQILLCFVGVELATISPKKLITAHGFFLEKSDEHNVRQEFQAPVAQ
jgi:hypothetical protein